jgi:two-component system aerobic respiration control sensor histidine kinase ArcB
MGKTIEYTSVLSDGKKHIHLSHKKPIFGKNGNVIGLVGISTDITELKQIQKKLREESKKSQQIFQKIIDALPVLLFWVDKNQIILGNNLQHAKAFGFKSTEQANGLSIKEFGKIQNMDSRLIDRIYKDHKNIMHDKKGKSIEYSNILADGKEHIHLSNKEPLLNEKGESIGVIGISMDITELKQTQRKLEQANAVKQEFIANMSHDLRTPITGVMGVLQDLVRLSMDTEEELTSSKQLPVEEQTQLLRQIVDEVEENSSIGLDSIDSLLQLCNEILEVTRLESGKTEVHSEAFDIINLTNDVISLLQPTAKDKKLKLEKTIDKRIPQYLFGSRKYINKILLNLISNALKFTKKGFIKIHVDCADQENISFKKGDPITLRFIVEDSGIGISKDKFETIFEHFSKLTSSYQGTYKGSGLGLYTVKQYIESMHGSIKVESEVGKGSQFIVTLPLIVDDHTDYIPTPSFKEQLLKRRKKTKLKNVTHEQVKKEGAFHILVVEDSPAAMMMVTRLLQNELNCTTDKAHSGESAVEKASQKSYDLILMDIGLPQMQGDEACMKIRALKDTKKANVPIVALTGHADDPAVKKKLLKIGMNEVLSKPASINALEKVFDEFVPKSKGVTVSDQQKPTELSNETPQQPMIAIDWDGSLHQEAIANDEKTLNELLSMLDGELRATKKVLKRAYEERNTKGLREELHKCRGSLTYLSLPELNQTMKAFHEAVKADPQDPKHLEKTFKAAMDAIEHFYKAYAEGPEDK